MLTIPPPPFHKRPARRTGPAGAPAAALVLLAGYYDPDGLELFLTFDRALDLGAIDLSVFVVEDGLNARRLVASGIAAYTDPAQPVLVLETVGDYLGADTLLNAGADNGIVAADDGGTWAGTVDLGLPFP